METTPGIGGAKRRPENRRAARRSSQSGRVEQNAWYSAMHCRSALGQTIATIFNRQSCGPVIPGGAFGLAVSRRGGAAGGGDATNRMASSSGGEIGRASCRERV